MLISNCEQHGLCETHKVYYGPMTPCPYCDLDRLRAEAKDHYSREVCLLAEIETLVKNVASRDAKINGLTAENATLREERDKAREEEQSISETCVRLLNRAEKAEAALEQARLDSHLAGMEEAKGIAKELGAFHVMHFISRRITEIEEKKHAQS